MQNFWNHGIQIISFLKFTVERIIVILKMFVSTLITITKFKQIFAAENEITISKKQLRDRSMIEIINMKRANFSAFVLTLSFILDR